MSSLTYTPTLGEDISNTAKAMLALAVKSGQRVTATFNEAPLLADPHMSCQDVLETWNATKRILWKRQSKRYAPQKRRHRKEKRRNIKVAWLFLQATADRLWGVDPVADLLIIEAYKPGLGWTYTASITDGVRAAIQKAYPKLNYKDVGVETPELFASWLVANAASMHFDGPTSSFIEKFHEKFPSLPTQEPTP